MFLKLGAPLRCQAKKRPNGQKGTPKETQKKRCISGLETTVARTKHPEQKNRPPTPPKKPHEETPGFFGSRPRPKKTRRTPTVRPLDSSARWVGRLGGLGLGLRLFARELRDLSLQVLTPVAFFNAPGEVSRHEDSWKFPPKLPFLFPSSALPGKFILVPVGFLPF